RQPANLPRAQDSQLTGRPKLVLLFPSAQRSGQRRNSGNAGPVVAAVALHLDLNLCRIGNVANGSRFQNTSRTIFPPAKNERILSVSIGEGKLPANHGGPRVKNGNQSLTIPLGIRSAIIGVKNLTQLAHL